MSTQPTDDEIETAILAALEPTGGEMVSWSAIQCRLPGSFWRKAQALLRLHEDGRVWHFKVQGRPYLCLGDELDREIAARYKAQGRVRGVRVVA